MYALAEMGEFLALVATGFELLRGRRSRLQTARAREITCTEKKPESSMLVEGCCTIGIKYQSTNLVNMDNVEIFKH